MECQNVCSVLLAFFVEDVVICTEGPNCRSSVHDLTLIRMYRIEKLFPDLQRLPHRLRCKVPHVANVTQHEYNHQDGPCILVADLDKHICCFQYGQGCSHEMIGQKVNPVHIVSKAFHDAAIRRDVEEEVHLPVVLGKGHRFHLPHRLVNQDPYYALFGDLAQGFEEHDREDFCHLKAEGSGLLLLGLVLSPFAYQII